jgi:hypothetical protein
MKRQKATIQADRIVQRYIRIANLDKKNATEDMGL